MNIGAAMLKLYRKGTYQARSNDNDQIRGWLSEAAPRWVKEAPDAG